MKIKAANLTINISDMDRSVNFYQNLGMLLGNRWGKHYAQLSAPGLTIGLHPGSIEHPASNSGNLSIGFTTDDFDGAKIELRNLGINFSERNEEGGQFLHFTDPDGNALYIIRPKW